MSMHPTVSGWLDLPRAELDRIYRDASPGPIPTGDTQGTAIVFAGPLTRPVAHLARLLAWQGKVFDMFAHGGDAGVLVNKVTPFGLRMVVAKVYRDASWMDGEQTVVIDYSRTSLVFRAVRDELRQVEPGVWLGKVWLGRTRIADFALTQGS